MTPAQPMSGAKRRLPVEAYNVGRICALFIEMAAAQAMLDEEHQNLFVDKADDNSYTFGSIAGHNIVIACLPSGYYGTINAAAAARDMQRSFPNLQIRLMVGIGGGAPGSGDLRLGDIVVGKTVTQYDLGKTTQTGAFTRTSQPTKPPHRLLTAVSKLRAMHDAASPRIASRISVLVTKEGRLGHQYTRPDRGTDLLFASHYQHDPRADSCDFCNAEYLISRPIQLDEEPKIHLANIASGNSVIKDGKTRDALAQQLDALCFEMEAAGLVDHFPCLVIRGICDYSDSHKTKTWQRYAAAAAAVYAKEYLQSIPPPDESVSRDYRPVENPNILSVVNDDHTRRAELISALQFRQFDNRRLSIKPALQHTCEWLLNHESYLDWIDPTKYQNHHGLLWISGKAGTGKSTLMSFAYDLAAKLPRTHGKVISYFFNARGDQIEKTTIGMYRALVMQLLQAFPETIEQTEGLRPDATLWTVELLNRFLLNMILALEGSGVTCFVDTLDECDESQAGEMLENFEEIGRAAAAKGARFLTCFSSRPYPTLSFDYGLSFTLQDQAGHSKDLERYVKWKLTQKISHFSMQIIQKASGIFLWAVLVVQILNQEIANGRLYNVQKRFEQLPTKLEKLFKEILMRDDEKQRELLLCMQWVLLTLRPLRWDEFYSAMLSRMDIQATRQLSTELDLDVVTSFVTSTSKGLVEVTKSRDHTVQFIHESVRDFILHGHGLTTIWPSAYGKNFERLSHHNLYTCCYNYSQSIRPKAVKVFDGRGEQLWLDDMELVHGQPHVYNTRELRLKLPFLGYAVGMILHHAHKSGQYLTESPFEDEMDFQDWLRLEDALEGSRSRLNMLNYFAIRKLSRCIEVSCSGQSLNHAGGGMYQYALFEAMANCDRASVRALLNQRAFLPDRNDIAMQLEYGDRFKDTFRDCSLLEWAQGMGHLDLIDLLIKRKDVTKDALKHIGHPLRSKLVSAIRKQEVKSTTQILQHNDTTYLDLGRPNHPGQTLLMSAVISGGNVEVIEQLISAGFTAFDQPDDSCCTPFWRACSLGYNDVVSVLLNLGYKKIDHTSRGGPSDLTPLEEASKNDHAGIVSQLKDLQEIRHEKFSSMYTPSSMGYRRVFNKPQTISEVESLLSTHPKEDSPLSYFMSKSVSHESSGDRSYFHSFLSDDMSRVRSERRLSRIIATSWVEVEPQRN